MLTALLTRGQIIIPAGYFPAHCLCHKEAPALTARCLAGRQVKQAGWGAHGAGAQFFPTGSRTQGEDREKSEIPVEVTSFC